jgi:hypothetical protein
MMSGHALVSEPSRRRHPPTMPVGSCVPSPLIKYSSLMSTPSPGAVGSGCQRVSDNVLLFSTVMRGFTWDIYENPYA